jgi:hypothetical protein
MIEIAVVVIERQVAKILKADVAAELQAGFARHVAVLGSERGADRRGRGSGSAEERGMAVGR